MGALINKNTLEGGAYSKGGAYRKEGAKSNHYGIHELAWDGFFRMPIFFSGINSLADILDIAVACHPLISFFFLSLLCFQAVFRIFILLRRCLGLLQWPYAHSD